MSRQGVRGGAAEIIGLVGDVGGTNARFAVAHVRGGTIRLRHAQVLQAAEFAAGATAVSAYLAGLPENDRPRLAVIAAAGPVQHGAVSFTNNKNWRFSETGLVRAAGLDAALLINDFTAQALALPRLKPRELHGLGPHGKAFPGAARVVMGPGTGFGAAALVDGQTAPIAVPGEGGHIGFAPHDEVEADILAHLVKRFGHVSIERVLSGPGLLNLYQILGEMGRKPAPLTHPAEVTHAALAGDPLARTALDRFCAVLGSVAGDFALAFGARNGVFISGGIAPDILDVLDASDFRRRFEDKGRMSDYLAPVATHVVLEPHAALIGSATQLEALRS